MDVYNVPEHGNPDAYLIQGTTNLNSQLTIPLIEPLDTMYNEGAPEFVVDQGMYYPSATGYSYICTGLESPGDWDDQHRVFGVDGQNIQFIGTQTESYPYVYYTPSYGYAQSPYNPYNPYIPGAMIGADGSFVTAQQYYVPSYENSSASPAYYPMVVQPGTDTYTSVTTDQFMDMAASTANMIDSSSVNSNSLSTTFTMNPGRGTNRTSLPGKVSETLKSNDGPNKIAATSGARTSVNGSGPASSHTLQDRGAQATDNLSNGKIANNNQLKGAVPSGNGLSNFTSSDNGRVVVDKDKVCLKLPSGKTTNDLNVNPNSLGEQNGGPRTSTSNTQLTVKAYTTRAGNIDTQGNITICVDQYNKDDFPVEYANAKFFVIKSYSEDDVHKSIKYNVWSSTPNGNKKLNNAYEEAQKLSAGDSKGCPCPVFLFFSVNASGQFCGVAEMTGRVDFHKDMDFWQQDKWSGSFPVKWHFIKDVPNPHFRHIILENNEHKPVTNSRDTQEIKYKKGVEMLKVFKNYAKKTSLLDDFMYYENRQKILQEEKARLLVKSFGTPVFVPVLHPPRKLTNFYGFASDEKSGKDNDIITPDSNNIVNNDHRELVDGKSNDNISRLKSLSISSEQVEIKPAESGGSGSGSACVSTVLTEPVSVVTVGSMPVKVNGFGESSGFLTVGTIPLDPKALKVKEGGVSVSTKMGTKKG